MPERTATKQRTRRALLLAGIEVLSRDPSAPLGQVAARAGVARSTLHRYFPDRQALMTAIFALAEEEYEAAFARSRADDGPGLEAFRRLCIELIERLEILLWWIHPDVASGIADDDGDGDGSQDPRLAAADAAPAEEPDERIAAVVARGHADGSIDPAVPAAWVEQLLWATLYITAHAPTLTSMTGFEARAQALRTLLRSVAADPGTV